MKIYVVRDRALDALLVAFEDSDSAKRFVRSWQAENVGKIADICKIKLLEKGAESWKERTKA